MLVPIHMKDISLPDYSELSQSLSQTALKLNPAQAHGLMCGVLCGSQSSNIAWDKLVAGGTESADDIAALQALYQVTARQLEEFSFDFQLMLPPDGSDIAWRAEALTLWCQGFLTGLKMADIAIVGREPSDVTEAISDMIEVAKMDYEEAISNEEDEIAYVELVEYVRLSAVLIYQDAQEERAKSKNVH
ncbi:MAG: UPF0149 family protein [Gammaproteobacteria bacterium]